MAAKLVDWAIRSPDDRVLDPSFGGLVFLDAASERLRSLGADPERVADQLYGIDLDDEAHATAASHERLRIPADHLSHRDFFNVLPNEDVPRVRAVVGNPPYVRYQGWDGSQARKLSEYHGITLTRLASTWAPFVVHAADFLAPGGRLAFVLPAQILHAQYAADIFEFLERSFSELHIAVFENRVFPGALEEVVLVFAAGRGNGPSGGVHLVECTNLDDLNVQQLDACKTPPVTLGDDKLLFQLLPAETQELYRGLAANNAVSVLGSSASVDIGAVTGGNDFFLLSEKAARPIPAALLRPTVSKAKHVHGARLLTDDISRLRRDGAPMDMFVAGPDTPEELIAHAGPLLRRGRRLKIHQRYKCRIRKPWWAVPVPRGRAPEMLLTYCSNEFPRLVVNAAGALHTNTLHAVNVADSGKTDPQDLVAGFYNSLTLLSAELVGRSYGGGVLKLEPTEAEDLLVPPLGGAGKHLEAVDNALRDRSLRAALERIDRIVLQERLGLSEEAIAALRAGAEKLRSRRRSRGKSPR